MMRRFHCVRRGFTLIELLIVVVILGILAAIIVPQASSARSETRDAAREADLRSVEKALEMWANDNGNYPTVTGWSGDAGSYGGHGYTGATGYIPDLAPTYIKELPRDPNPAYPTSTKGYLYQSNGKNYKLLAWNTPESFTGRPLVDPTRPTTSWSVYTPGGKNW